MNSLFKIADALSWPNLPRRRRASDLCRGNCPCLMGALQHWQDSFIARFLPRVRHVGWGRLQGQEQGAWHPRGLTKRRMGHLRHGSPTAHRIPPLRVALIVN